MSKQALGILGMIGMALFAAQARAISAPGHTITEIALPGYAQGDVVVVGDALFVGSGPGFSGAGQSVLRIDANGTTVIADGFNSLAGFAYDPVGGRLLVGDNGLEALGSETGDTIYSIPSPLGSFGTPLRASDIALAPAGSVPGIADIVLDPNDPNRAFLSDASSSFPPAGRTLAIDLSTGDLSVLQTGLGYAAGLAADAGTLFLGDVNGFSFAGEVSAVALPGATGARAPVAGGLGGQYDLEVAADGSLLSTSLGDLLRIDPTTGVVTVVATGFGYATGLFEADGTIWVLDGGFPGVATIYQLTAIPEPGTLVLAGLGLAALAARRRVVPL